MAVLIECPSCKRRLEPPDANWDRRLRCPSCQTTFVGDSDGNCLIPSDGKIVELKGDPLSAPVSRLQEPSTEDEFSQICGENDLDPVLLKRIIDPRWRRRFSRPFLVGFLLTIAVGVLRVFVSALSDRDGMVEIVCQSIMFSLLFGVMNGVFLTLLVDPPADSRKVNQDGLAPYLWMALVWFVITWLFYKYSRHPSPIDETLQFAPFTLVVATFFCWVFSVAVGLALHGRRKDRETEIRIPPADTLEQTSDSDQSNPHVRRRDSSDAQTTPRLETDIQPRDLE